MRHSVLLVKVVPNYARSLRRTMPARPISPVPSRPSVPGSGVTMVSPLIVPSRPTPNVIWPVPPAVPRDACTHVVPKTVLTVPLVNVPVNRVAPPADVMVRVPPVKQSPDGQAERVPVVTLTQPRLP